MTQYAVKIEYLPVLGAKRYVAEETIVFQDWGDAVGFAASTRDWLNVKKVVARELPCGPALFQFERGEVVPVLEPPPKEG